VKRYESPLQKDKRQKKRIAAAVGAFGTFVTLALLAGFAYTQLKSVEHDDETNCPNSLSDLAAYTVILIDATDKMNSTQVIEIKNLIKSVALNLPSDGRLDVLSVTDSGDIIDLMFCRCSLEKGGEGLGLIDNPRLQKVQWEEAYWGPLTDFLNSLDSQPEASHTPLMEGIQKLSSHFPFEQAPQLIESGWNLIIISDLLQNSATLNLYQEPDITFEEFRTRGEFHSARADLEGANVKVHLVHRPRAFERGLQGVPQMEFWNHWFSNCRVRDFHLIRLIG